MESDRIPLSSAIFFGTENNSESRFGNWETCNHGGEGLIQRLGTYWLMGMLVAWAQGLLGRKRIGPLHMDFLWVISSARVGSESVDSRVEDFASSLPALFTIYVLESARNARVRFRETQNHCLLLVSRCWSLWRYFRASTQEKQFFNLPVCTLFPTLWVS